MHSILMTHVSITMLPVISGGDMHKPCHVPTDQLVDIDGKTFARLPKSSLTTRCVMGFTKREQYRMCILDHLRTMRNDVVAQHINKSVGHDTAESPDKSAATINGTDGLRARKRKGTCASWFPMS